MTPTTSATSRSSVNRQPSPGAAVWSQPGWICVALAILTLALYVRVTGYEFVNLDDPDYASANPRVKAGLTADGIGWAFTTGDTGNWHPLTWLSLMFDAEFFSDIFDNPAAWSHLVNVMLHIANTVLLFLVLRRLTGAHWRSAFVAGLFAWHPLHVESVAWISERKDVLSTLFWLLTVAAYAKYVSARTSPSPSAGQLAEGRKRALRFYIASLVLFALGLMSKPMLVTLPFTLLLLDYWPLARSHRGNEVDAIGKHPPPHVGGYVIEKIPFFALSAISCVITYIVQNRYGAVRSLTNLSLVTRIENAFVSYAIYLEKTFWPSDLAVFYPHPVHWPAPLVILSVVLILGLSIGSFWIRRRWPFVFTGWFWFVGTLVPVIGLVQVGRQAMADRYSYVPLIGLFVVISWGAAAVAARARLSAAVIAVVGALVAFACGAGTLRQLSYWKNSEVLFRHALACTRNNYLAHVNLGIHLLTTNRPDEAIAELRRALAIRPDDPDALNALGATLANRREFAEANQLMQRLVQVHPQDAAAYFNYGAILGAQEKWEEASAQFSEALRLQPDLAPAQQALDEVRRRMGK